jgi:hypothetical protein
MGGATAFRVSAALLCVAAAVAAQAAPFAPGLAPRSPEVMLYFSHSLGAGAGASMRPTFGLRVQQVRQAPNMGDPEAGGSMQHRELVDWQLEAHSNLHISDLRVKLADRVTYDLTNRRFGSPGTRSAMALGLPTLRYASLNPSQSRPVFAHNSAPTPASREPAGRETSAFKEIAVAAVAALAPSRFMSAQRQNSQHPSGGIAGVVAAQRMQGARAAAANAN